MIGTRCDLGFSVYNKFSCCTIPGMLSSFLYTSNNGVAKDRPGWACPISRGSHLYVPCSSLAGVTLCTSLCPTLSADTELGRKCAETVFSAHCTVWCQQKLTSEMKGLINNCKKLITMSSCKWKWLNVVLLVINSLHLSIYIMSVSFPHLLPLCSLSQDIVTHKLKMEEVVKGIELVNNSRESVKVVLLPE